MNAIRPEGAANSASSRAPSAWFTSRPFEILTLIGGGMGEVYRARDTRLTTEGFANAHHRFIEIRGAANEEFPAEEARRRVGRWGLLFLWCGVTGGLELF